jgi:hypothetical protein
MTASSLLREYDSNRELIANDILEVHDEGSWYVKWQSLISNDLTPMQVALKGGLYASAPPWIFVSGYQAAIRNVFPELPKDGWAAFAASEDRQDPQANPPMRVVKTNESIILQGTKSWVAQSRHVDYLVITALTQADENVSVMVNRHREGITLTHRKNAEFLPAMSQGFARIHSIDIANKDILSEARRKEFVKSESKFVMLSCSASMYAKTAETLKITATPADNSFTEAMSDLKEKLRILVIDLARACENSALPITELAILDKNLQTLFVIYEKSIEAVPQEDWQNDRKIFSLYSDGIQKWAAKNRV